MGNLTSPTGDRGGGASLQWLPMRNSTELFSCYITGSSTAHHRTGQYDTEHHSKAQHYTPKLTKPVGTTSFCMQATDWESGEVVWLRRRRGAAKLITFLPLAPYIHSYSHNQTHTQSEKRKKQREIEKDPQEYLLYITLRNWPSSHLDASQTYWVYKSTPSG